GGINDTRTAVDEIDLQPDRSHRMIRTVLHCACYLPPSAGQIHEAGVHNLQIFPRIRHDEQPSDDERAEEYQPRAPRREANARPLPLRPPPDEIEDGGPHDHCQYCNHYESSAGDG